MVITFGGRQLSFFLANSCPKRTRKKNLSHPCSLMGKGKLYGNSRRLSSEDGVGGVVLHLGTDSRAPAGLAVLSVEGAVWAPPPRLHRDSWTLQPCFRGVVPRQPEHGDEIDGRGRAHGPHQLWLDVTFLSLYPGLGVMPSHGHPGELGMGVSRECQPRAWGGVHGHNGSSEWGSHCRQMGSASGRLACQCRYSLSWASPSPRRVH